jgi:hypothetical protein
MTCSHCHETDHNKNACADLLKKQTRTFNAINNSPRPHTLKYHRMLDGLSDEINKLTLAVARHNKRLANAGKPKRQTCCGFCHNPGHRRDKCGFNPDVILSRYEMWCWERSMAAAASK